MKFDRGRQGRGRPGSLVGKIGYWDVSFLQDGEVGGGVAAQVVRVAEEQHAAFVAADCEMPGDDEAVARIVAFTAENRYGTGDAEEFEHVDTPSAGVFHEDDAGDAVFFDGDAIDFARLLAGQGGR